jgi:hypothetical protein
VTVTRGMEFGVSPMPESRRRMIDRHRLFGTPAYCWIPARSQLKVKYWALAQSAETIPDSLNWPAKP